MLFTCVFDLCPRYTLYTRTRLGYMYYKRQVRKARENYPAGHSTALPMEFNGKLNNSMDCIVHYLHSVLLIPLFPCYCGDWLSECYSQRGKGPVDGVKHDVPIYKYTHKVYLSSNLYLKQCKVAFKTYFECTIWIQYYMSTHQQSEEQFFPQGPGHMTINK